MRLEELICNRLLENAILKRSLTRYGGSPAVFYQSAPYDTAPGWRGKKQYPRIDFAVDMQANPERHCNGFLTLNIWCAEDDIPPEDLEPEARSALCDVFLQPDNSAPFSLAWSRTDAVEFRNQASPSTLVIGSSVQFDLYAFPCSESTDPDPVLALHEFIREWMPEAVLIGKESLKHYFFPTAERPAVYFRLAKLKTDRETNTVVWMNAELAGHLFAPEEKRFVLLKSLADELSLRGEVMMLDGSPMFIQTIQVDSTADRLMTGQLQLGVRFGLLRQAAYAHPLVDVHFK